MVYVCVYLRKSNDGWPFDGGDDPAFRCSVKQRGPLTWGVCRPDVRNALREGDGVVYFAADRLSNRNPARYQFVGFATVEQRVTQTDIWKLPALAAFRRYGNLLIRPTRDGFEHHEPALEVAHWHNDWFWRINGERALTKDATRGFEHLDGKRRVGGRPVTIASNYIVFSTDPGATLIVGEPPTIASAQGNRARETWERTPIADALRSLLLAGTGRKLRTTNPSQAHRHIRLDLDTSAVFRQLHRICRTHGLHPRNGAMKCAEPQAGQALRCG
jgi:hypothetical protein